MSKKRLMIIAGGTGGHVFPGLTIANVMIEKNWQVLWLGTADRIEADLVPKHGINIKFICISGLRNKNLKILLLAPIRIFNAWRQARRIIKEWSPNVVLGMGSYVSGPGCLAAWSCGIPVIIHEQNSVAGLTNKWLAKIATRVMEAFPGTLPKADTVGNLIRKNLLELPLPKERFKGRNGPLRLLVMGGSQGADIINKIMPHVAAKLDDKIIIWHQTGKNDQEKVKQAYITIGQIQHKVVDFIDDMAEAYSWADIVLCRSGALTVSELIAIGLPSIFVPFSHKDRHQYLNALFLERIGASKIFLQSHFTVDAIEKIICSLNRAQLLTMAEKARQIYRANTINKVSEIIICVAK
ncbi:undecaprenyldiphospho-muramoylpentapeptide beta-N-acetylglucosaminyltransferase [Pantoea sp. Aalb]|uniref:undecaprenyldiphospho-muramoylpentapeptide beta-N-acetylglucosaminyltransferase n=1 Tax=Pantoea sp. Aalb TaxID=2576762 RepID=UPI0013263346|nr:undecaprenyldiphospho-muramoylpentapeptide beta-N-acetylglucosaminyltransferase [Pantoea sp. Aalb]MXP67186.1 undecaprenyldiphospho-muramoylpentapeptide beta-N-acetylglucosaminyltransferase [Pantoea sp. Aalb]